MSRNSISPCLGVVLAALLAACTDNPMAPPAPPAPGQVLSALVCTVNVQSEDMSCVAQALGSEAGANLETRVVGGQDLYVKLRSSGTSYDGVSLFQTNVTVQNLLGSQIGTNDGLTPDSVNVFFASGPTVTGGTGNAEVANEDGTGTFTIAGQEFFYYPGILDPYEISASKNWQFTVDNTVTSFVFTVFVSANVVDSSDPLFDAQWQGDESTDWQAGGNWRSGFVPGSTNAVNIAADSLLAGSMPVLTANAQAKHLRVGFGTTLGLGGFGLEVGGNLDAPGTISGGTTTLSGAAGLASGAVDALAVTGSYALQGATTATGAVSITGSLNLNGNALTISAP